MGEKPKKEYVKIQLEGHGSYIQPYREMGNAMDAELGDACIGETITLHLTRVNMTQEEYDELPEFEGH